MRPRRIHRHASGTAHSRFGALPALNHKRELSAGRDIAPVTLVWLRATGPHSTIYRSRVREDALRARSGCRGGFAVLIALPLIEREKSGCRTPRTDCPVRTHFNLWWARHGWLLIHLASRLKGLFSRPPYFRRARTSPPSFHLSRRGVANMARAQPA